MDDPIPPTDALQSRWFTWTDTRFGLLNFQREDHLAALTERLLDPRPPAVVVLSGERGIGRGYLCEAAAERVRDAGRRVAVWHLDLAGFEPATPQPLVGYLEHLLEEGERRGRAVGDGVRKLLVDFGVEFGAALTDPASGLGAVAMSLYLQFHDRPAVERLAKTWSRPQGGGPPRRRPVEALHRFVSALAEEALLLVHVVDSAEVPFDVRRWLIREAEPGRVLVAFGCGPYASLDDVAPGVALGGSPLRLDLAPLDVHGLQAILDRRFAPHALPPELAPALVRYSGGWPALLANAAADLMAAECLRRDDQDVWHLPEGTTSPAFVEIVSSALFDEVDAELARIEDADLRGRVSRFLVLAALCGRYVPLALPFACMGLTKDQGNDVIDWLDEVLAEQLGWMHDMGFGHRFFRGFNVYSFAHPVLPHAILARLAASEYQRAGEAVTLLRFLEHQNVRVAERAMARMFLSIAEHLDPKDREPYERSLEWWISLGGVDALRGALREDLQSGRLDPELLWRIAEGAESWRALPRLALLDAYGEAVLVGSGDEDEGPRLSPDRWFGFHSLRARLLVVDAGRYAEGLAEAERAMALAEGDDVKTSYALWLRGAAKQRVGDYDAARSDLETALDICERLYVGPNLSTSSVQVALAQTLQAQKDYQGAREMTTAALETCRRLLGPEHPETLRVKLNLEAALSASGETDDAQKLALETLEAFVRVLGPEHPSTINAMEIWGRALIGGGNLQGARDLIEPALPVRQRLFGPEHPGTLVTQANLAKVLLAQGELKEARGLAEETLGAMERVLGPEHPEALEIAEVLDEISAAEREASEEN